MAPQPPNVMGRFFFLLLLVAIGGMFFYHTSEEKTVSQEEALTFQKFLAKQTEPTATTEEAKPTRVPGYGAPHFIAEGDDLDIKLKKEKAGIKDEPKKEPAAAKKEDVKKDKKEKKKA